MKKKIEINFFCNSKKWNRRSTKLKNLTIKTIKIMKKYFNVNSKYFLNIILTDKKQVKELNKKYKQNNKDTDVLTFISTKKFKQLNKEIYCDVYFSINTIEKDIKKNNINFYEHFNHLIIHSFLHINGYSHQTLFHYNKMKKLEIMIMNKLGFEDPYLK